MKWEAGCASTATRLDYHNRGRLVKACTIAGTSTEMIVQYQDQVAESPMRKPHPRNDQQADWGGESLREYEGSGAVGVINKDCEEWNHTVVDIQVGGEVDIKRQQERRPEEGSWSCTLTG